MVTSTTVNHQPTDRVNIGQSASSGRWNGRVLQKEKEKREKERKKDVLKMSLAEML